MVNAITLIILTDQRLGGILDYVRVTKTNLIINLCLFYNIANQEWEQNLRIYNLQLERERLKTRRQEIAKLNVSIIIFFIARNIN